MAKPRKPAVVKKGKSETKGELKGRSEVEKSLLGRTDAFKETPEHLTYNQKQYYSWLVEELENVGIVGNLDIPILEQTAVCIDRIRQAGEEINTLGVIVTGEDKNGNPIPKENPAVKIETNYMTKYAQLCNQLGLSPASRASLAGKKIDEKEKKKDAVLQIVGLG